MRTVIKREIVRLPCPDRTDRISPNSQMEKITSYTCNLSPERADRLKSYLLEHGYRFKEAPYTVFFAEGPGVTIAYYTSGKLVVQGRGTADFVLYVLEPYVLGEARFGYEEVLNPELLLPRIGIDESGKGDYFGPLCTAGVYVNEQIIRAWRGSGIRDSKNISSDARISELAKMIRKTPGVVYEVVEIGNRAYNRLYERMRSVNKILAWAHARVIENLMEKAEAMQPPPVRAISDQFASSKSVLERAIMRGSRQLELIQRHKAEEDVAVAAASILARDKFISALRKMSEKYSLVFPCGANERVVDVGREFVAKYGAAALGDVAKLHFRTTQKILGSQVEIQGSPINEAERRSDASANPQDKE